MYGADLSDVELPSYVSDARRARVKQEARKAIQELHEILDGVIDDVPDDDMPRFEQYLRDQQDANSRFHSGAIGSLGQPALRSKHKKKSLADVYSQPQAQRLQMMMRWPAVVFWMFRLFCSITIILKIDFMKMACFLGLLSGTRVEMLLALKY